MEKLEEFNPDQQSLEDWIEVFEARAACTGNLQDIKKVQWCRSVIGGVGRKILGNLEGNVTWDDAKAELRRFLGEQDTRAIAWNKLKQYKASGKSLGEIASDVLDLARMAATEVDVRQRLATEAFIEAIPWRYAMEIRKKRINNVEAALQEVKLLQMTEEEGVRRGASQVLYTDNPSPPPPQREMVRERERNVRKKPIRCWGCEQEGHVLRNCPVIREWKEKQKREGRER